MKKISLVIAVVLLSISTLCFSDTIHVPTDQPTIQAGIDVAVNGDIVLVAPGTYDELINFNGKAIEVTSSGRATDTWIRSPSNSLGLLAVVTFEAGEGNSSILTGFTITRVANPLSYESGILCRYSSPTITNNIISLNAVQGVYSSGSGIMCQYSSSPIIDNNIIINNGARMLYGGGIECTEDSSPLISNNIISGNLALAGSGILSWNDCSPVITNNIISGNEANQSGGGICFTQWSSSVLTNNTIIGNKAHDGGGIYFSVESNPTIVNTILSDNEAIVHGPEICSGTLYTAHLSINHSLLSGGANSIHLEPNTTLDWGPGMIDADPLFVNPTSNDFHLTFNSPCKDAGDNTAVTELFDFESDPRIAYGTVDMGADEFYNHLYCTGSFMPSGLIQGKFIGLPATWPLGLFIGSGIIDPPMQHGWGEFYLESPWLLFPLVPIPSNGVLEIPATLPSTPAPYDIPMQALIGWELSNLFVLEVR